MDEKKTITFGDIAKANKGLKSTNIKGKNYIEVNQRIKAFRILYPEGTISTEIIILENGVCIIKAVAMNENGSVLGVGHAFEKESTSYINKTSYIENCETSAVGRALGMCGIGIEDSVASAEEVENAINQEKQTAAPKTTRRTTKKAEPVPDPTAAKEVSYICERCGGVIGPHGSNTPKQIATASKKLFNKVMCFECAHQTKEEAIAAEKKTAEEAKTTPETIDEGVLPFPIPD